MSHILQHINQIEPLTLDFSIKRKDDTSLPNYTFSIQTTNLNPNPLISTSPTFPNSYFVPTYAANTPNSTTIKLQAYYNGMPVNNEVTQLKWDFGDGKTLLIDNQQQVQSQTTTTAGNTCSVQARSFKSGDLEPVDWDGSVTYSSTNALKFSAGAIITISGMKPDRYNGTFKVQSVDTVNSKFVISGFDTDPGPSISNGTYAVKSLEPVYHKYVHTGPTVGGVYLAQQSIITLTAIDKYNRKTICSKSVYPKPNI